MNYSICLATTRDAAKLKALEEELFPENSLNETTLRNEILGGLIYVARVDKLLMGYMICREDGSLLDVLRLGVLPAYRREYIASRLLEEAMSLSNHIILTVHKNNNPAIALYQKYGFEIIGSMPQPNCWVMQFKKSS